MSVDLTRTYRTADVYRFPFDGHRYELLDGELHVTPLARRRHQDVVGRVYRRLAEHADAHGGRAYPGVNVDLDDGTHLEPDVAYARSEDTGGLAFDAVPELVVEVSSPSTRRFDLGAKRERYAAGGVLELWYVELEDDEVLRFPHGRGDPLVHRRGERCTSPVLPGTVLDVDDLLGPPERP